MTETAPILVKSFGSDLAARVADLARADPRVLRRVVLAPPAALHSYAIWLRATTGLPAETAARTLYETAPETLLAEAVGGGDVRMFFRILAHVPATLPPGGYTIVFELARSPMAAPLARNTGGISITTMLTARGILAAAADEPLVLDAAMALLDTGRNRQNPRLLASALTFLRANGCLPDEAALAVRLRRCASGAALARLLAKLFDGFALPRIIDIPKGSGFQAPGSIRALRRLGLRARNCLSSNRLLIGEAAAGRLLILEHAGQPHAIVALDVVSHHADRVLVAVRDMKGPGNAEIADAERAAICDGLRRIPGLKILEGRRGELIAMMLRGNARDGDPFEDDADFPGMLEAA
jgi:hypothetical protein